MIRIISVIAFLVVSISHLYANVIQVPQDFETIASAIVACEDGDTVLVARGTYENSSLHLGTKSLTLASAYILTGDINDIYETELSGDNTHSVIDVSNAEQNLINIVGLTISGGFSKYGGGIKIFNSSPILSHLIIVGNLCGVGGGAGVCAINSSPTIENCIIAGNISEDVAGGYYGKERSCATLRNVIFAENVGSTLGGGSYLRDKSQTSFTNVIFVNNRAQHGSAIAIKYSTKAMLDRCLILVPEYASYSVIYSGLKSITTLVQSTLRNDQGTVSESRKKSLRIVNVQGGNTHRFNTLYPGDDETAENNLYSFERIPVRDTYDFQLNHTENVGLVGYPISPDPNGLLKYFGFEDYELLHLWVSNHLGAVARLSRNNTQLDMIIQKEREIYARTQSLENSPAASETSGGGSGGFYSKQFTEMDRYNIERTSLKENNSRAFDVLMEGYLEAGNIEV